MAKANDNQRAEQQWNAGQEQDDAQQQPADGGGLRERTEQQLDQREQFRAAEDYAPPAGEGAKVNPDAQRNDPDGEARPTA